jgi:hypothetical protein
MITGRRLLAVAAAVSWAITLVITAPGDSDAWHSLFVGMSSALLAAACVAYITEARRARLSDDLYERLSTHLTALDEVLKYGIEVGKEQERKENVRPPVLMKDFRAARHCGPTCAECRDHASAQ